MHQKVLPEPAKLKQPRTSPKQSLNNALSSTAPTNLTWPPCQSSSKASPVAAPGPALTSLTVSNSKSFPSSPNRSFASRSHSWENAPTRNSSLTTPWFPWIRPVRSSSPWIPGIRADRSCQTTWRPCSDRWRWWYRTITWLRRLYCTRMGSRRRGSLRRRLRWVWSWHLSSYLLRVIMTMEWGRLSQSSQLREGLRGRW